MQINEAFALLVLRSKKTYLCTMYIKQYERVERRFKVTHLPQDDGGSKVLLQTTQMGSDNIPNTLRSAEHPPAPIRTITITHRGSRCCTHGCSRLRSRTARFRRQGMEGKGYPSKVLDDKREDTMHDESCCIHGMPWVFATLHEGRLMPSEQAKTDGLDHEMSEIQHCRHGTARHSTGGFFDVKPRKKNAVETTATATATATTTTSAHILLKPQHKSNMIHTASQEVPRIA